jgi:hypothetical protein
MSGEVMPVTGGRLRKYGCALVTPVLWLALFAGGYASLRASGAATPDSQPSTTAAISPGSSSSGTASAKGVQIAQAPRPDISCPQVEVRRGAATLTVGPTGEQTAMTLKYQGSFVRLARECAAVEGNMVMKVGVEGRIVLGPAGSPGPVSVPLRFAVVQETPTGARPIATKFIILPVEVGATGNTPFIYVEEALSFPIPTPTTVVDDYIVYVGFDPVSAEAQAKAPKPRPKEKPKRSNSKPNPPPSASGN